MGKKEAKEGLLQLFRFGVADSPGLHMVAASAGEVTPPSSLASLSPPPFSHVSLVPSPFFRRIWYHPPLFSFLLLPSQVAACLIRVPTEIVKQRRQVERGLL